MLSFPCMSLYHLRTFLFSPSLFPPDVTEPTDVPSTLLCVVIGRLAPTTRASRRGQLEEERSKGTVAEERQKELTVSWLKERDDLKKELSEVKRVKEKAERDLRTAKKSCDTMVRRTDEGQAGLKTILEFCGRG